MVEVVMVVVVKEVEAMEVDLAVGAKEEVMEAEVMEEEKEEVVKAED